MFVTAYVDDDTPYLGQQITYTFKFYRRSALFPSFGRYGQPRFSPPGFSGFWKIQEPDQDEYTEIIGSNRYQVVELTTVLFPTVVGTLVIEPAGLTVPIDFFEAPNYLEAESIVVEVLAPTPGSACGVHRGGGQVQHLRRRGRHGRKGQRTGPAHREGRGRGQTSSRSPIPHGPTSTTGASLSLRPIRPAD